MKEEKLNRTRVVTLRLTTKEYEKIKAKCNTTTCRKLSDYMRYVLLEKKITVFKRNKSMDDFMAELILLRSELNAIGKNYNQVVKKLNSMQSITEIKVWFLINESAKESLVKKVDEIKLRINQFSDKWSQE
jgi:ribonuclease HIII